MTITSCCHKQPTRGVVNTTRVQVKSTNDERKWKQTKTSENMSKHFAGISVIIIIIKALKCKKFKILIYKFAECFTVI